jgi:hypothetical protein
MGVQRQPSEMPVRRQVRQRGGGEEGRIMGPGLGGVRNEKSGTGSG